MEKFFDLYMDGKATIADLETHFENWHNSSSSLPVEKYLGLTMKQYNAWCDDPDKLEKELERIKRSRRKSGSRRQVGLNRPENGKAPKA